jgi:hypothetical protein
MHRQQLLLLLFITTTDGISKQCAVRFFVAYKETPESQDEIADLALIQRHYLKCV